MRTSAIIIVGKEIVIGQTQDSNSFFIGSHLTQWGINNKYIAAVDDNGKEIVDVFRYYLDKVDIVIVSGGLGPTFDDMTMEAVAVALNRRLYLNNEAFEHIKNFYEKLYKEGKIESNEMNEKRMKMAYLIEGCKPLKNSVGAAWGAYINMNNKHVFVLPGLPKEMKAMFLNEVEPILKPLGEELGIVKVYEFDINDESVLGGCIDEVMKKYDVYIKSLPVGFDSKTIKVRFTAYNKDINEGLRIIEQAKVYLDKLLNSKNIL